jgi:hypothetical protein
VDAFIRAMMDDHAPLQERVAELEATLDAAVQVLKGKVPISASHKILSVPQRETDPEEGTTIGSVLMSAKPSSSSLRRLAYALVPLLVATGAVLAVKYLRSPVLHRSAIHDAAVVVGRADPAATTPGTAPIGSLEMQPPASSVATSSEQSEHPTAILSAGVGASPASTGGLTILLTARERCWIRAMLDGERKLERELDAGEQATVQARNEVVLRVGNAAAISLTINGVAALPLGRPGEPVTTRITPDNYLRLLGAIPTASSLVARPEKPGPASGAGPARTPVG